MNQRICLITGATEGVGKVTAIELAKRGFTVVLAARNETKAKAVKQEIERLAGTGSVDVLLADLASLNETRALAHAFRERYARLDVLINNAGVFAPERAVTADGFERSYQVNYLSHFLLTQLLLERLTATEGARVINLSSSVASMGKLEWDNLQSERRFSVLGTYSASKLFMLMFSVELAERLRDKGVTANAVHPGIVRTQMMLNAPGAFRLVSYLSLPFSISPQRGAETSVYLATSREVDGVSGLYFTGGKRAAIRNAFDTEANRKRLWDVSLKSLGGAG